MKTLRPNIIILSGAVIGLVAGAAVYGTVSTASASTPTSISQADTASTAHCAAGKELEHGVCVIDLERTGTHTARSSSDHGIETSDHNATEHATNAADATEPGEHTTEVRGHDADNATTETVNDLAEHATNDRS
jgi:hypothetical protein